MVLAAIHGYTGGHCGVDHHAVSRHDICSSRMNKYQLSLFIQALQRMTDFNIPRQLFCANVANTRGLPCGTAGGCALPKMKKNGNYVHDVEPCPSERRPSSCAFIEHEICRHAHDIALQYSTDKACWKQAARDLCLPCLASTRCDPCELPVELSSYAVTILVPCYNKTVERLVVNPLFCGIAHDQGPRNISAILKDWFPCIDPASITYNISNDRCEVRGRKRHCPTAPDDRQSCQCNKGGWKTTHCEGHLDPNPSPACGHPRPLDECGGNVYTTTSQTAQGIFWYPEGMHKNAANANYSCPEPKTPKNPTCERTRGVCEQDVYFCAQAEGIRVTPMLQTCQDMSVLWTLHICLEPCLDGGTCGTGYLVEAYIGELRVGVMGPLLDMMDGRRLCQNNRAAQCEGYLHLNNALLRVLPPGFPSCGELHERMVLDTLGNNLDLRIACGKPDCRWACISRHLPKMKVTFSSRPITDDSCLEHPRRSGDITYHHVAQRRNPRSPPASWHRPYAH